MSSGLSESQPFTTADDYATLRGEVRVDGSAIRVAYTVTIRKSTPVLIFDALLRPTQDGGLKYDRDLAFVSFVEPTTLAVKRVPPPVPKLKSVLVAYEAFAHLVGPGKPVVGEIRIRLPAEEYNPYYLPGNGVRYRNATASRLHLVWLIVPLLPGLHAVVVPDAAELHGVEGTSKPEQLLLETEIHVVTPVAVKIRADRFERI